MKGKRYTTEQKILILREAEEWENSCKEADAGQTWRNAKKWIEHVKRNYPKTRNAKTADTSIQVYLCQR